MINRFKNSYFEAVFLLSPCFVSWGLVFNFYNVKHILSKLILLVCIYCLFFYRLEVKIKIKKNEISMFMFFLFIVGGYFSFLHYFNDGHFDFARTVFACLFYFLLVPSSVFNSKNLALLISLSSIMIISKGIYDSSILGEVRIGKVVNPGPYAYICSLLLITQLGLFLWELKRKVYSLILFYGVISIFLTYIVYLTGTRAAWLGLFIVLLYFVFSQFKIKGVTKGVIFSIAIGLLVVYISNVKFIHDRIARSVSEIHMMIEGDFNTSSGIRVDLWRNGLAIGSNSLFIGMSRSEELEEVQKAYEQKKLQVSAYRILNHSRSSYHNVYVQSFVKGGLVALFLMLVWIYLPTIFRKSDVLKISVPLTIMTVISSGFESQFTIYSACAYFYLLLTGYLILMDININKTGSFTE